MSSNHVRATLCLPKHYILFILNNLRYIYAVITLHDANFGSIALWRVPYNLPNLIALLQAYMFIVNLLIYMKNTFESTFGFLIPCMVATACGEDEYSFLQAVSLKVVYAISDAPPVHVNYFGGDINFATNPTLGFGSDERYT